MKFGLIEMDGGWPYTSVGKMAIMFVMIVLIFLIYSAIKLFILYRQLWRYSQLLGRPLLNYYELGKWNPEELSSWRETRHPKFILAIDALRKELLDRAPISACSTTNQALDLLAGPFMRLIHYLQVLGWSACLVIWIGGLGEIKQGFRALGYFKDPKFAPFALLIEDTILMLIIGMAVGLACLWVSSFWQGRLNFIRQDLSNRILAASAKKPD
ncbi:MAG: hypothetical protein HGA24_04390 [Candidatus Aminicenantes bacterium]|jgi:hypothetical protein|nr:hypothetical protein [Candidatus Aminicenantes bacterium]